MDVERDLLVISDLHLGEALGPKSDRAGPLDDALVSFLDHHARDGRWRLVVNGDMMDLVGATFLPSEIGLVDDLHPDDHLYGLGGKATATVLKLRRVLERHDAVFRAFARFLAAGHPIDVVLGNHDAELHWEVVQAELACWLRQAALEQAAPGVDLGAVTFHPWFFLQEGVAFFEHGHQYDPYCAFEELLEPATDEREIDVNLGALLPRYVGSRMLDPVHEAWGLTFVGFLRFWVRQGGDRVVSILKAYVDVFRRMWEHQRTLSAERRAARRARAGARLVRLARRLRLPEERLRRLSTLWVAPIGVELLRIVRALMLDRFVLLFVVPLTPLVAFLLTPWGWQFHVHVVLLVLLGVAIGLASKAREPVDPQHAMRRMARQVRELMSVPFVVMGHTHVPYVEDLGQGWYINTGTWVEADPERAFTHLRIEHTLHGVRARLCQWREGKVRSYAPAGPEVLVRVPAHARSR